MCFSDGDHLDQKNEPPKFLWLFSSKFYRIPSKGFRPHEDGARINYKRSEVGPGGSRSLTK